MPDSLIVIAILDHSTGSSITYMELPVLLFDLATAAYSIMDVVEGSLSCALSILSPFYDMLAISL